MIRTSQELGEFLSRQAGRAGVRFAHDTHYDARNWEMRWWAGNILNRLDFQPQDEASLTLEVLRHRDAFPRGGRLLNFANRVVPFLPYFGRRESESLAIVRLPIHEDEILAVLARGGLVGF